MFRAIFSRSQIGSTSKTKLQNESNWNLVAYFFLKYYIIHKYIIDILGLCLIITEKEIVIQLINIQMVIIHHNYSKLIDWFLF